MGIFDWLSAQNSNVVILEDGIWLSNRSKFTGIAKAVNDCFSNPDPPLAVILVAHFEDCLAELHKLMETNTFAGPVTATLADELESISAAQAPLAERQIIEIIVAERHPLRSHDDATLQFARCLTCRCRVTHHVSLEDPLMKLFAGPWVEDVLKRLGMKEDEVIRSQLVARRIAVAQQKIESLTTGNQPCKSAQEWIELNCSRSWD